MKSLFSHSNILSKIQKKKINQTQPREENISKKIKINDQTKKENDNSKKSEKNEEIKTKIKTEKKKEKEKEFKKIKKEKITKQESKLNFKRELFSIDQFVPIIICDLMRCENCGENEKISKFYCNFENRFTIHCLICKWTFSHIYQNKKNNESN